MIGFGQESFYPHYATFFIAKAAIRYFVENAPVGKISDALQDDTTLASHSPVYILTKEFGIEYKWHHHKLRPWGQAIPLQCTLCNSIKKLKFTAHATNKIVAKCKHCKKESGVYMLDPSSDGTSLDLGDLKVGVFARMLWGKDPKFD